MVLMSRGGQTNLVASELLSNEFSIEILIMCLAGVSVLDTMVLVYFPRGYV